MLKQWILYVFLLTIISASNKLPPDLDKDLDLLDPTVFDHIVEQQTLIPTDDAQRTDPRGSGVPLEEPLTIGSRQYRLNPTSSFGPALDTEPDTTTDTSATTDDTPSTTGTERL